MNSRRRFLKEGLSSGFGFGAILLSLAKPEAALASNYYKETKLALGTIVSITTSQASTAQMDDAIQLAFQEIERLENIFSRYNPNTPLALLNSKGSLASPPKELLYLLQESLKISQQTHELYNPCVKPLLDLYIAYQNKEKTPLIPLNELQDAQKLASLKNLKISPNSIEFLSQGMGITLDSIAKGYIIDSASSLLLSLGIENHLINAGGDILAKGYKAPQEPWIVAIENPKNPVTILHSFPLINSAVATSGSYQHFYDKKGAYHHIINPVTGKSPSLVSLSCKAKNAMLADAWTTAATLATLPLNIGIEKI